MVGSSICTLRDTLWETNPALGESTDMGIFGMKRRNRKVTSGLCMEEPSGYWLMTVTGED